MLDDPERLRVLMRTRLLDSSPEPEFDRVTELVCALLQVPVALVSLVDATRQFWKSARGLSEPWASARGGPLGDSLCRYVVESGAPFVVQNALEDARVCELPGVRELPVGAYLGVPLTTSGGVRLGSLCAIDSKPRNFTAEHQQHLSTLARLLMSEIELRLAAIAAEERRALLDSMVGCLPDGVVACDAQGHLLSCNLAARGLLGDEAEREPLRAFSQGRTFRPDRATRYAVEEAPLARALEGRRVEGFELYVADERFPDGRWLEFSAEPLRDADQRIVGAVAVGRDVTEEKLDGERLAAQALTDSLTGLQTRRSFLALLGQHLRQLRRSGQFSALFYVAVNGMRIIQEQLGHVSGDQVLRDTAELLQQTFRDSDILGRTGVDEFAVCACEAAPGSDELLLGRLLQNVERFNREQQRPYVVSLSVGILPCNAREAEPERLLRAADRQMFEHQRKLTVRREELVRA